MSHRFLFLHFGGQCPLHSWMIEQAKTAAARVDGTIEVVDVMKKPELAERYRLFFPFMTIIDGKIRLPSPISANKLVKIAREGITAKPTIQRAPSPKTLAERIEPLTVDNIIDTCSLCIPGNGTDGCQNKQAWASMIKSKSSEKELGFIAYKDEKVVGAVEFLPAPLVPYPLPEKDPAIAFITCIYPYNKDGFDYRDQLLKHLIDYLRNRGYKKLHVIAGRQTPNPNGPTSFFLSHGFKILDKVDSIILKVGKEELVLMEKVL
ncbi:GNAT family N-acetyltransferase [Kosmotoga sp. DU53]|uniref:GNAT family N-acetyltransferase n=1 Tax=Kosmotoga sp. DU53 TaxID=1310160 RepID=UPI0007C4AD33|nr:GNAT family N-acetyltransferase [Kosmotoga sp. DU53]OAA21246.1 hypothetical protein DU53_06510 [Kosmotoga sp. DU53]